jgi:hypothetical protein
VPGGSHSGVLARVIALRLADTPIESALREVAQRAQVRLAYSIDIIPADERVTIARDRITVGDAFQQCFAAPTSTWL